MTPGSLLKILAVICFFTQISGYVSITAWNNEEFKLIPPPYQQVARMARYIVHSSDWCSISSIGSKGKTTGYPKSRDYSFVDGVDYWSSGIPYIYTTLMDPQIQDLTANNRSSVTISLGQSDYCRKHNYDPEDPRCAQVILTGQFTFVSNTTKEYTAAKNALFQRHPVIATWPKNHNWQVGKLSIEEVQVIDYFGGSKYPTLDEYFHATPY